MGALRFIGGRRFENFCNEALMFVHYPRGNDTTLRDFNKIPLNILTAKPNHIVCSGDAGGLARCVGCPMTLCVCAVR